MSVDVRVSVAQMYQRFHGCEPEYIKNVCHARCCDAPSKPGGTMVTIHRSEAAAIRARGGLVRDGLLDTSATGICTFKTEDSLCGLHFTPDKPFGCIASPFTLNHKDLLIVRNRYRLLKCYEPETGTPAYVAFRASLVRIFGEDSAEALVLAIEEAFEMGDRFVRWPMPLASYDMLHDNDDTKRKSVQRD